MNKANNLPARLASYILLLSLLLESCHGFSNSIVPKIEEVSSNPIQVPIIPAYMHGLGDDQMMAQGGYLVRFYTDAGMLRAEVTENLPGERTQRYSNLRVYMADSINLAQLRERNKKVQQQMIEVKLPWRSQPGYVYVGKRGLLGGMMEEMQTANQVVPKLDEMEELYDYFYRRYLELTPDNCERLVELYNTCKLSFESYEGGLFVKDWQDTNQLASLKALLQKCKKITKLKINCIQEDRMTIVQEIIRPMQFYKNLVELDLGDCQLSDAIIEEIMDSVSHPRNVRVRNIVASQLSPEVLGNLQAEFLDVQFQGTSRETTQTRSLSHSLNSSKGHKIEQAYEGPQKETLLGFSVPEVTAYKRLNLNKFLPIIPREELAYGQQLGVGGMGIVYQASYQGNSVAVKKLLRSTEEEIAAFQKEAVIMANHRHKNIVAFLGFCPAENALIMEFASGGSLWNLLKSAEELSWQLRYQIALDVCKGMNYLHGCGIVHSDLKSDNILLDHNRQAKVTDFGVSALKNDRSTFGSRLGWSYRWLAPEIFHTNKNSKAGDVYSYGMILWQLGARKEPFEEVGGLQIPHHIAAGNREVISQDTPKEIKKLINLCWLPEPPLKQQTDKNQRLSMEEVERFLLLYHGNFVGKKEENQQKVSAVDKEKEELVNRLKQLERELAEERQQKARINQEQEEKREEKEESEILERELAEERQQKARINQEREEKREEKEESEIRESTKVEILDASAETRKGFENEAWFREALFADMPLDYELGAAYDDGDCFFDALAQWLNKANHTDLNNVKYLRMLCHDFYMKNKLLVDRWNQQDDGGRGKFKEEYTIVQYTAEECATNYKGRSPIWGRPWVEGKILCNELQLPCICIIEVLRDPETGKPILSYQYVDRDAYKASINIEEIRRLLAMRNIPVLVNVQGKLHFVPFLLKEHLIQRDCEASNKVIEEKKEISKVELEKTSLTHPISFNLDSPIILSPDRLSAVSQKQEQLFINQEKAFDVFGNLLIQDKQGDPKAAYEIGMRYAKGEGVMQDDQQAVQWYQKAAEKGYAPAQLNLGIMYQHGKGVEQNDQEAVKWYRAAADQGNVAGQCNLGFMYQNGRGVSKDDPKNNDTEAVSWYRKAAEQGHAVAQCNLGFMYQNGRGIFKNDIQAREWYEKSAQQGYPRAQNNLAVMLAKGEGGTQDEKKAKAWFEKAAAQGDLFAQTQLKLLTKQPISKPVIIKESTPGQVKRLVTGLTSTNIRLHDAVASGDIKQVQKSIEFLTNRALDINIIDAGKGGNALHLAVDKGYLEIAKLLIQQGVSLDAINKDGNTPLHLVFKLSIRKKSLDLDAISFRHGVSTIAHKKPKNSVSTLNFNLKLCKLLIEQGADITIADKDGNAPLHLATEQGHLEVVNLLIEKGADLNTKNKDTHTPLHLALEQGHLEVAKLLIREHADLNVKNKDGNMPLHLALEQGHLEVAKLLIQEGAGLNEQNKDGNTPLHLALKQGHLEVAKLLIEKSVNLNLRNNENDNLLDLTLKNDYLELAQLCIEKGAGINTLDKNGNTPLHVVVKKGDLKLAQLLIEKGAGVNTPDIYGDTPLHHAAAGNHKEIVQLLY